MERWLYHVLKSVAHEFERLTVLCNRTNDIVGNSVRDVCLDLERYGNRTLGAKLFGSFSPVRVVLHGLCRS